MLDYITSLLPRLQQFSKGLNDTAIFADVPWVFIDGDGDRVTYIFRRNNELLVSKQGEVTTGHWEYLAAMQSLLIEHGNRKRMYNQGFVDNVVMALRKDGTEELFLLANQQALPDLDAVKYLERKVQGQLGEATKTLTGQLQTNQMTVELKNPARLALVEMGPERAPFKVGNKILDLTTRMPLPDGKYHAAANYEMEVKDGIIVKVNDTYSCMDYLITIVVSVILIATMIFAFSAWKS